MDRERDEVHATVGPDDHRDDGYVTPDFDPPSEDEDDVPPPPKRTKLSSGSKSRRAAAPRNIEDEEEMALRLLRKE